GRSRSISCYRIDVEAIRVDDELARSGVIGDGMDDRAAQDLRGEVDGEVERQMCALDVGRLRRAESVGWRRAGGRGGEDALARRNCEEQQRDAEREPSHLHKYAPTPRHRLLRIWSGAPPARMRGMRRLALLLL